MSIKTILAAIGTEIKKIFDGSTSELKTVILPAIIAVGNAFKTVLDGDTTDIIGKLAGAAGAALEDKVRQIIDKVVPELQLAQQFLASGADSATILANIAKLISTAPAATQAAFYIEFTGLLASDLASGLTLAESVQLSQWFYQNYPTATPAASAPEEGTASVAD